VPEPGVASGSSTPSCLPLLPFTLLPACSEKDVAMNTAPCCPCTCTSCCVASAASAEAISGTRASKRSPDMPIAFAWYLNRTSTCCCWGVMLTVCTTGSLGRSTKEPSSVAAVVLLLVSTPVVAAAICAVTSTVIGAAASGEDTITPASKSSPTLTLCGVDAVKLMGRLTITCVSFAPYLLGVPGLPLLTAYARTLKVPRFGGDLKRTLAEPSVLVCTMVNTGTVLNSDDRRSCALASPPFLDPAHTWHNRHEFLLVGRSKGTARDVQV
jgi:hypothetical protein